MICISGENQCHSICCKCWLPSHALSCWKTKFVFWQHKMSPCQLMVTGLAERYWHTVLALVSLDFNTGRPTRRNPIRPQNIKDAPLWLYGGWSVVVVVVVVVVGGGGGGGGGGTQNFWWKQYVANFYTQPSSPEPLFFILQLWPSLGYWVMYGGSVIQITCMQTVTEQNSRYWGNWKRCNH